ncbi:MAG TPA: sensor histidine kinase [Parafilimonas sp.]|nr:sensor histidine kinase [Parafilimonas sp.]
MKASKYTILFHIVGCISFFLLPLIFFPHPSKASEILSNPPTQRDFISQLLLIAFFYFNHFYLIPLFYFSRKYVIFHLVIFLSLLSIVLLPSLLTHHTPFARPLLHIPHDGPGPKPNDFTGPPRFIDDFPFFAEAGHVIFLFFVVFFFSLVLKTNDRLQKVQQEKTDAELVYLRSQINPHFLFNTLNLIYSLTIKKTEQASEAIVKLANMMRYVLYDSDKNYVLLQQEINYIKNYIELQQTRFENAVDVLFDISGEIKADQKIAPLIFIPFVENAFKHGVNAEENSTIKIHIDIKDESVSLAVYNRKVNTIIINEDEGGVGLTNTKNRLQLLYPGKHELKIENNDDDFSVYLKIKLA